MMSGASVSPLLLSPVIWRIPVPWLLTCRGGVGGTGGRGSWLLRGWRELGGHKGACPAAAPPGGRRPAAQPTPSPSPSSPSSAPPSQLTCTTLTIMLPRTLFITTTN